MATDPLPPAPSTPLSFYYRALTREGQTISGAIDAATLADAQQRLQSLQLNDVQLEPAGRSPRARALRGDDFAAFNQQLAQLTGAGLPVEQGLRLIAQEMGSGSLRQTLNRVAADLETGKTLPQAITAHRRQFPPLYAQLVDAGIRAGNLSAILLNLGRHLTLVRRMQAMLWRTFSYPVFVLAAFGAMFFFILVKVFPQFQDTFTQFHTEQPIVTATMLAISAAAARQCVAILIVGGVVLVLALTMLWLLGRERIIAEGLLLRLPLVGPVLRRNLIARWCDAVALGIDAGMDLPGAISMADDAIGSAALKADGSAIIATLSSGQSIAQIPRGRILPPMVASALDLSAARNDLPQGLTTLSQLYQQQAELRLGAVEVILTPLVIIIIGLLIGAMMFALFAPLISLINAVASPAPWHH